MEDVLISIFLHALASVAAYGLYFHFRGHGQQKPLLAMQFYFWGIVGTSILFAVPSLRLTLNYDAHFLLIAVWLTVIALAFHGAWFAVQDRILALIRENEELRRNANR